MAFPAAEGRHRGARADIQHIAVSGRACDQSGTRGPGRVLPGRAVQATNAGQYREGCARLDERDLVRGHRSSVALVCGLDPRLRRPVAELVAGAVRDWFVDPGAVHSRV